MATFVLVHGSCHGGWCWKKVTPLLTSHSHRLYTPTLTGLGERTHLLRENIDLSTHILDITQVFGYEDLDDVILVGHSYGGMVISGVAERIPDKIRRLVYLDGYIPEDRKTAFDLIPGLEDEYKKKIRLHIRKNLSSEEIKIVKVFCFSTKDPFTHFT